MDRIGRYQIVGELGRGAMGVVYRAQDPTIGRTVAIKTIRLGSFSNEKERNELRRRLYREAQSAGILSHPGIVTIYDVSEEGEDAYVFMEFVNGQTLEQLLDGEQPPSRELLLDLLRQVAAALDYAHARGIIHRDIKPANIMVHDGKIAKITDFGVARIQSQTMTTGGIMGTPNYMSPEQIRGEAVDGKADQFSLAVIVYELLTGEKPFSAESMATLLFKIVKEEPLAPQRLNPSLGPAIEAVLRKAMDKDQNARYPTCSAFIADLERAVSNVRDWRPMAPGVSQSMPTLGESPTPPLLAPLPVPVKDEQATIRTQPDSDIEATRRTRPTRTLNGEQTEEDRSGASAAQKALVVVLLLVVLALAYFLLKPYLGGSRTPEYKTAKNDQPPPTVPLDPTKPSAMPAPMAPVAQQNPAKPDTPPVTTAGEKPPKPEESGGNTSGDSYELSSIPTGADVVFDGDAGKSCKTPCRIPLARGAHTLVIKLSGYAPQIRRFQFPGEVDAVITLEEQAGTLYISSDPAGASLTIDGEQRTEKTPASLKLRAGEHQIQVVKEGFKTHSETVRIRDGGMARFEVGLSPQ